jgi:hypothetical protein
LADPFGELAVPQAVVRMRQGFGRLIRSTTDRGVVVVLDSRLVTRRYGQVFFDSVPPATRRVCTAREVVPIVDAWWKASPLPPPSYSPRPLRPRENRGRSGRKAAAPDPRRTMALPLSPHRTVRYPASGMYETPVAAGIVATPTLRGFGFFYVFRTPV